MSDEWQVFLNSPLGAVVGFAAGSLVVYAVVIPLWWLDHRERQRWQQQEAECQRQWAFQRQLWELEDQIREERLSEEEREWRRRYPEERAEIKREARRRLFPPCSSSRRPRYSGKSGCPRPPPRDLFCR
jgi:hypothetical protein